MDDLILVIPWQDEEALLSVVQHRGDQIAAIMMEPINYNSGCIPADREYLAALRALTERHGRLLVFDEVLSAFRTGPDCAQGYYGILPDLCAIAKGIANGAPIALVAGRRDLMRLLSPLGPVAHSGTYTDHLLALSSVSKIPRI